MNIFKSIINNLKVVTVNHNLAKTKHRFIAKQIQINQLPEELNLLFQGKTEFDFIGINSNGDDCIYFAKNGEHLDIEYEAMEKTQILYYDKLKLFAF
ncbi:hypothetical protein [Chryseobacterium indoltheticum]|uniref:hypothetical protein n=1 Tax=Chryseobacterium indoltheticum TaxID=254 RepID=UPI003F496106